MRPQTPTVPNPPAVVPTVPGDGVALRTLGIVNGPVGFTLPTGVVLIEKVDQPNVVAIMFSEPKPSVAAAYLREHLPGLGFVITGDKDDSLVFSGDHYDGAFTATGAKSGLTLRLVRG